MLPRFLHVLEYNVNSMRRSTKRKSKYVYIVSTLFVVFSLLIVPLAHAESGVPNTISYQGRLADSGGSPLGGAGTQYYFKFSLWDSPTVGQGSKVWPLSAPGSASLTVRQGSFNVNIGDTSNGYPDTLDYNFNSNKKVYLQVEISNDNTTFETLSPRSPISSAPFSQVSGQVSGVNQSSFGTTTPIANSVVTVQSTATDYTPFSIKGIFGQVAKLINIFDSVGNSLFSVGADGMSSFSGKVGIGTSTPNSALYVNGNIFASSTQTASTSALTVSGTPMTGGTGSNNLPFMYINPQGVTAPNSWSTTGTLLGISMADVSGQNAIDIKGGNKGVNTSVFTVARTGTVSAAGALVSGDYIQLGGTNMNMRSSAGGLLRLLNNAGTGFTRFTLGPETNAFPGLGVSSPLNVTANGNGFYVSNGDGTFGSTFAIGSSSTSSMLTVQGVSTNPTLPLFTVSSSTGATLFSIKSNGNVGIGTSTPAYKLDTQLVGTGIVASFKNTDAVCTINPTTSSFSCTSDLRLKNNIESIEDDTLGKVMELNPVSFNWKTEESGAEKKYGFLAQEVEAIFPSLVATNPVSGYKSLSLPGFIPFIVKAVKDINTKVESLAASVKNLVAETVTSKRIQTDEMCVGATCVDEVVLKNILKNNNAQPVPSTVPLQVAVPQATSSDSASSTTNASSSNPTPPAPAENAGGGDDNGTPQKDTQIVNPSTDSPAGSSSGTSDSAPQV